MTYENRRAHFRSVVICDEKQKAEQSVSQLPYTCMYKSVLTVVRKVFVVLVERWKTQGMGWYVLRKRLCACYYSVVKENPAKTT
jgi:hypothetical protein